MKEVLKYLLLVVGGVGAVLVALALYLVATFNPNDYKPQLVQVIREKFDRTLKVSGDIKLTFYPALGAELGSLSLSEHASDKEFAAMDSLNVSLELLPLLSRKLVINRVELRGLHANLVKHANGSSNIDDLRAEARAGADTTSKSLPAEQTKPEQKTIRFSVDHVQIQDASLDYVDELSAAKYTLRKGTLRIGSIEPEVPSDIDLAFVLGASQPKVEADVHLKTRLSFAPDSGHFKLDALELGIKGDAAGMKLAGVRLRGSLEGDAKILKSDQLVLEIDAQQGPNLFKGRIASPLALDLGTQTLDLNRIVANLSIAAQTPDRAPIVVNVTASARADMAQQRASLDFSSKIDESTVTGKAGLAHFSPPAYVFDVNLDQFDLDRYLGNKKTTGKGGAADRSAPAQSQSQAFDVSALRTLQANGNIRIGAFKLLNLRAQNVHLGVSAGAGRLDLNPLVASLYQGTASGSVSLVAAASPQLTVKQNLSAVSIGPLLKDALDRDPIAGRGNVMIDVAAQGATLASITKALHGAAVISLADGALKGINLGQTLRQAQARIATLKGETSTVSNASEQTDFTELKASFAITNGIAHNSDLSLKSPLLRLGGEGDIDLGANTLDYLTKVTLVASAAGQGGKSASELKGFTVPVRISGPLATPNYKLDFNALASGAAQQKIDEKKEQLKSKVQDKLKDQLKGLLRR